MVKGPAENHGDDTAHGQEVAFKARLHGGRGSEGLFRSIVCGTTQTATAKSGCKAKMTQKKTGSVSRKNTSKSPTQSLPATPPGPGEVMHRHVVGSLGRRAISVLSTN